MEDTLVRFLQNVLARIDGPLHFRIILQPTMAILFAIRDGLKDARLGKPAYFWAVFTQPELRNELLQSGWKSISKVFLIALGLDVLYQIIFLHWFYPLEALLVATALALVPYALLRGFINRMSRQLTKREVVPSQHEESVRAVNTNR